MRDIETNGQSQELHVGCSIRERRLDKYLHGRFANYSRSMIQEIIKAGAVKVNGKVVKQSFMLSPGDKIELTLPKLPEKEIQPEEIPLNILYEDNDIIVINKPADIIVHPARGNTHGTIANALAFHLACGELAEPASAQAEEDLPRLGVAEGEAGITLHILSA